MKVNNSIYLRHVIRAKRSYNITQKATGSLGYWLLWPY